ncbi:PAS domain-containing sensor histidine kinase [Candidatus Odyssella acanthamoebae]|uniref:histidine kinase n=1 Tax=Candidatus Odyssella acanthamoebae TaxID=91604 RepID=A0A077B2T9_9PROT|nr:PAS domain-containing sensor histidine kinase [Candidatus Paracaedibacter acanthamoebae]AIK97305.1 hypothetical protein ID47_12020 [Candidatus Paracaedibacter acanthamoebae]
MKKCIDLNAPLEDHSPQDGAVLELFAPYAYALSKLMAEKDGAKNAEAYSREYVLSFIKKLRVNVGFLDKDGNFIAASPPLEKSLRSSYGKTYITGVNIRELAQVFPPEVEEALKKNLAGVSIRYPEVAVQITSNQTTWVTWESFPWFGADEEVMGIFFFCKDITKEKELQLDLSKLYSRTELLSRFSLIFSHDLIQPLRQISTYVSLLELELEDTLSNKPGVKDTLDALNRCISKAKEICKGIVLYCKNGDLTVNREPVTLSEVMDMTLEFCAERPDIIIENFTPEDLILDVNKACLLQLFQNLLDNAIKHSTSTPIEITFSGKYLDSDYYEFSLHNNGWCGNTLKQKNVFNAFYSNYADGAGLGLMICKKIVDAYGGKINFISTPEDGTRIDFSLPLFNEAK